MARKTTLEQINHQIATLQRQADEIANAEKAGVIERIRVAIQHYGLTAADLGLAGGKRKASQVNGKAGPARKRKVPSVKYRDPAGNAWSGMGRKPRWFVEAIANGKTEAELRA